MLRAPLCAFLCRHRRQPLRGSDRTQRPRLCPNTYRQHPSAFPQCVFGHILCTKPGFIFGLRRKGMRGMGGSRITAARSAEAESRQPRPGLGDAPGDHEDARNTHQQHPDRQACTATKKPSALAQMFCARERLALVVVGSGVGAPAQNILRPCFR